MIDTQHFHELEQLINSGQYSEARHRLRSMLEQLQHYTLAPYDDEDPVHLAAALLSDTLDMLLLYRHESQITTYPVKAARLLCSTQP